MSVTPLMSADRVANLVRFGYTDTEGSFLCVAALHGGYFLRRQVAHGLKCQDGATVTRLAQKVLALEHARSSTWRQNVHLYHLFARPFYDAIGERNNRNRREHQLAQIKNRIMGLDYVLAHPEHRYLATEREKIDYFVGQLNVDVTHLPAKQFVSATGKECTTRYFIDKYPLFVAPVPQSGRPDRAGFCFVDEGLVGLSHFETYLDQYRDLFAVLPAFDLIYVAATNRHFAGARATFERFCGGNSGASRTASSQNTENLLAYFHLRQRFERRELAGFDRNQLIRLRDGRNAFSHPEIEALYRTWTRIGDAGIQSQLHAGEHNTTTIHGSFSTERLTYDYDLFGTTWPR